MYLFFHACGCILCISYILAVEADKMNSPQTLCHKAAMLNGLFPLFHSVYMLTVNPTQPPLKQQAVLIQSHHALYLILMNRYELISK